MIGKTLSVPVTVVLFGLMSVFSFMLSHSHECVGTYWSEPVIIWMAVAMTMGSGKSTVLSRLIQDVHTL